MALPMLMEMKPDVLITDIRMPFMDGLELAKVVRRTMPWLRIVFLSGHDEFEYAQKAVSLHADAYLLKPVSSAQLLETLGQVAEQIEQSSSSFARKVQTAAANTRRTCCVSISQRPALGQRADCRGGCTGRTLGAAADSEAVSVCIVRLPENAVQEQVRALTERLCGEESEVCAFFSAAAAGWCSCCAERPRKLCAKPPTSSVRTCGMSFVRCWAGTRCARSAHRSPVSAPCRKATAQRRIHCCRPPHVRRTAYSAARTLPVCSTSSISRRAARWRTSCGMPPPRTCRALSRATSVALRRRTQSVLYRYYLLMNLLVTASQLADEVQAGSIPPPEDPQAVLGQAATLEGTKACAAEVLGRMTRLCYRHQNVRYSAEISRAKEFIRENYADSGISLHMVAAEVGFSPNHFSTVFSQETGQTFVEYLTAVRIEAAKHLLIKGNSRMSDIAFDVGYQDSHYFSYLFKKHVGVSPREYRSRSEEG